MTSDKIILLLLPLTIVLTILIGMKLFVVLANAGWKQLTVSFILTQSFFLGIILLMHLLGITFK